MKWFIAARGVGVIRPNEGENDLYTHSSEIQNDDVRTLELGQRVEFEVEQDSSGRTVAVNVWIASG